MASDDERDVGNGRPERDGPADEPAGEPAEEDDAAEGAEARQLPADLPRSLDDRKSFPSYGQETEYYDAWQGAIDVRHSEGTVRSGRGRGGNACSYVFLCEQANRSS